MSNKVVGKIKEKAAKFFTTKDEFDAVLPTKADYDDLPVDISELENDVPFIPLTDLNPCKIWFNSMRVTFENGILLIDHNTTKEAYYYFLLDGTVPLTNYNDGGLRTGDGFFENYYNDYRWGNGCLNIGFPFYKEGSNGAWTLEFDVTGESGNNLEIILCNSAGARRSKSIAIQNDGTVVSYRGGVASTLGTLEGFIINDGEEWHIQIRYFGNNEYQIYISDEINLTFNYSGFTKGETLTLGIDWSGSIYVVSYLQLSNILVTYIVSDANQYEIQCEDSFISYSSIYTLPATLLKNGSPKSGEFILAYDDYGFSGAETDVNGVADIPVNLTEKVTNKSLKSLGATAETTIYYHNLELDVPEEIITDDGSATITATLTDHSEPIINADIRMYVDSVLVDTQTTDEYGQTVFEVNVEDDTTFEFNYDNHVTNHTNVLILGEKTFNVKFDGTERFEVHRGNITQEFGVLSGVGQYYGHLTEYTLINGYTWEVNLEAKCDGSNGSFVLTEVGQSVNDKYEINISATGAVHVFYNNGSTHYSDNGTSWNNNSWTTIKIEKTAYNQIVVTINGISKTYTWQSISNLSNLNFGIYSWGTTGGDVSIRNLVLKTNLKQVNYDTIIYNPALDGTEEITTINTPLSIEDNTLWGATGYLSEGFPNTEFWEVELEVYKVGVNNSGLLLVNKGTNYPNDIFQLTPDLQPHVYNLNVLDNSSIRKNDNTIGTITTDDWTKVKFTKINPNVIRTQIEDNTPFNIVWNNLTTYNTICVGISRWITNSYLKIRNIKVKVPHTEVNE